MVICPDAWLVDPDGRYAWSPDRGWRAWTEAMAALQAALGRAERLVVLVGMPGAGKSTRAGGSWPAGVVVFDATMVRRGDRRVLIDAARAAGVRVDAVWMDTPVAVCRARNAARSAERRVPDDVFERMAAELAAEPPSTAEGFGAVERVG